MGFIEGKIFDIHAFHPDVEIEKYSVQEDHIYLVIIIPPRYSVSGRVGKIRRIRAGRSEETFLG